MMIVENYVDILHDNDDNEMELFDEDDANEDWLEPQIVL